MSFLDVQIIREDNKFNTSAYHSPTFSEVYTHFGSILPSNYKLDSVQRLVYRCFWICSSRTKLQIELMFQDPIFLNGYPEIFINKCFKRFMDNIHVVKKTTLTVENKTLALVFLFFGSISWLQTRSKLKKLLKSILNC